MYLLEYLRNTPVAFIFFMAILGLVVGSFLNVVIHRLPKILENDWRQQCRTLLNIETPDTIVSETYNLILPRSRCPQCNHQITALENIPVLSYLLLGGKCSVCKSLINVRYPVIELTSGFLAMFCTWHFGFGYQACCATLLSWSLLTLSAIDLDHQLLPDDITLPLLWLGILFNMTGMFTDIRSSLLGTMVGYTLLWSVYQTFKLLTGKEGMGYGDFKLLAMLGAWLGWQMLPLIILLSSIAGALIGLSLIVFKQHDRNKPIPFGPYLALAGWVALIWGHDINSFYVNWSTAH